MHGLIDNNFYDQSLIIIIQPLQGRDKMNLLYHNHWKCVNFTSLIIDVHVGSIEIHFLVSAKKAETFLDQPS